MHCETETVKTVPSALEDDYVSEPDEDRSESVLNSNHERRQSARKSREELNEIEKKRTKRINDQIHALRSLLEVSMVQSKSDKYSVLKSTYDYILELNQRVYELEAQIESQSRLKSIQNDGHVNTTEGDSVEVDGNTSPIPETFDFKKVFKNSAVPLALAHLNGTFIDTNHMFSDLAGFSMDELQQMSLMDFTSDSEVGRLVTIIGGLTKSKACSVRHFWFNFNFRTKIQNCFVSIHIIRNDFGIPQYLNVMLMQQTDGVNSSLSTCGQMGGPRQSAADTALSSMQSVQNEAVMAARSLQTFRQLQLHMQQQQHQDQNNLHMQQQLQYQMQHMKQQQHQQQMLQQQIPRTLLGALSGQFMHPSQTNAFASTFGGFQYPTGGTQSGPLAQSFGPTSASFLEALHRNSVHGSQKPDFAPGKRSRETMEDRDAPSQL